MMLFVLVLLAMTVLAVLAVLVPLARRPHLRDGGEEAVYRDQLAEIERDRAEGRIDSAEAEAARTEVARRLLAASASGESVANAGNSGSRRRAVAVLALVVLPIAAGLVYSGLGRPDLPDLPLASREEARQDRELAALVSRVESELARRPDDGQGWEVIAPVYLRTGQPDKAAKAYENAIRLLGSTAEREAGHGEALTIFAKGTVSPEAQAAFQRSVALDPNAPRAHFYLARAAEQEGDPAAAAEIYRKLLQRASPDAPYLGMVREALAAVSLGEEGRAPAVDPKALENVTPDQRLATIRGMVEGLEARLNAEPGDLGGQLRLIRAWSMFGEEDRAKAAAEKARTAFAGNPDALRRIGDLLLALGVEDKPA